MQNLTQTPAWLALEEHFNEVSPLHLRDLFNDDPQRFEKFSLESGGLFFDYSKNRITAKTMTLLMDLARQSGLEDRIKAMFSGQKINSTEHRAVLHTALRNLDKHPL
ncbi:MAG: glucose-6-phosphate isomerase, partial [Burkholderiales bacterium]|nr:glucose-6-phosphate isomerase [Burkholderiales bacterium]